MGAGHDMQENAAMLRAQNADFFTGDEHLRNIQEI